jgi:hypothetical protein
MPQKQKLKSADSDPHPNLIGVAIGANGAITNPPTRFAAHPDDIVVWAIGNTSGQPITVTLFEFDRKKSDGDDKGDPNDGVMPFNWLVSNIVQIEDQALGLIAAQRDPNFKIKGVFHDRVSYTIRVESRAAVNPFPSIDYDPDGDIKP